MRINKTVCSLLMLVALSLSGCAKDLPGDYDSAEVGKIKKVVPGTIISMRPVRLHSKNAELSPYGNATDATKATASSNADFNLAGSHGYEYVIKLNSGNIISVVQSEESRLKVKQKILVIYGRNTRVVADNGSEAF